MTTLGRPARTRRDEPLVLCALVAAVVVAGYLAYFRLMTQAVPHLFAHWPRGLFELLQFLIDLSPYALFSVVLMVWGRSERHRIAGALCALVAGVHHMLQLHSPDWQSWEFHHRQWWVGRLEFIAPMVAACLACWLIEALATPPGTRSSA